MIGFGLDLAGFTNDIGTVLAAICASEKTAEAEVTLLTDAPFSWKINKIKFSSRLAEETAALARLVSIGRVAVDVPIDLQGLPIRNPSEPWQLTQRPVDRACGGLPPLASWLGACVARFNAILTPNLEGQLDAGLFETYPAASLKRIFGKQDKDVNLYKKDSDEGRAARKNLTRRMRIECGSDDLSHDKLDAIICAVAAVAPPQSICFKSDLELSSGELPKGYRILKDWPFKPIRIMLSANFYKWVKDRESRI